MTHFRRYEFKKRRYCSQPAVANLHDFSDNFVEDLKSKIRLEATKKSGQVGEHARSGSVSASIREDALREDEELGPADGQRTADELEEARLINGIKKLANRCDSSGDDDIENERPRKQPSFKRKSAAAVAIGPETSPRVSVAWRPDGQGAAPSSPVANSSSNENSKEDPVFKSANWLSDSELIFSLSNQVGGLVRALRVFQELDIGIKHVESRPSKRRSSEFEIFVDIDCSDRDKMRKLVHHLRHEVNCLTKEEFERWSRSPALVRQGSQIQSPLNSSSSAIEFMTNKGSDGPAGAVSASDKQMLNGGTGTPGARNKNERENKALALMVQPSVDYEMLMEGMPWFPRHISELDQSANRVLMYGNELDADHPGFKDPVYRKRRREFTEIALNYRYGDPIPRIQYSEEETKTWSVIFEELSKLYERHACKEFNENFKLLQQYCGYRKDNIPQLEDIAQFLRARTGFIIRPVAGYLSSRDFLAGLAFRVFHCTQYIRHSSDPFYTPEPDCCHEILGHCPLLADRNFAQFSQELGLASLGASDEEVDKLATCYFFTIEFGLCKQGDELKVYGAGLLSSIAELKHAMSNNAHIIPFDPIVTCQATPIITAFQEAYFTTDSFEDAKLQMREFSSTIKRPFGLRYNPYTQSVEILSNTRKIMALVSELKGDICTIRNAIKTLDDEASDEEKKKLNDLEHLIAA